jgi:hypothetical protein
MVVSHFKFLSFTVWTLLKSACYIFTKITRPLISKWRAEGKSVLMFLDDGYGCAKTADSTKI